MLLNTIHVSSHVCSVFGSCIYLSRYTSFATWGDKGVISSPNHQSPQFFFSNHQSLTFFKLPVITVKILTLSKFKRSKEGNPHIRVMEPSLNKDGGHYLPPECGPTC